jgi:hypothetical protein
VVGQAGLVHGGLAPIDPLLHRAAQTIQGDDPQGASAQVGDDETDAGLKFAGMPFDLGGRGSAGVVVTQVGIALADLLEWMSRRHQRRWCRLMEIPANPPPFLGRFNIG